MKILKETKIKAGEAEELDGTQAEEFALGAWREFFVSAYKRNLVSETEEYGEEGTLESFILRFEGFFFAKNQIVELLRLTRRLLPHAEQNKIYNILDISKSDIDTD